MQEEILIKKHVTGTTVHYFNTDINEYNFDITTIPAILKLDSTDNVPLELHGYDGVFLTGNPQTVLWKRNTEQNSHSPEVKMNFVYDNLGEAGNFLATGNSAWPNPNYISGRTFSETLNISIDDLRKDSVTNKFTNYMNSLFTAGTTTFVFFEPVLIEDFYANIKLEKTYDVLNTLSIYNKVSGEYPIRESATGVVFGKLEAIQKITDTNGNKIRIPLRNVPIGIFTTSDDFQTPTDLDENGNRIRLNYRPLTETEDTYPSNYSSSYFNEQSSSFDNTFLKSVPLDGIDIHPTFSNVVYTNENGEFFLHNIEIGPQILFFEVDLLKQGLTKDEVALNFFPYPANYENISIDTIPHYFYRAIPIDVVPSWGTSYQTGYTEVNVSVNLDLRKWATYIIPPVTYSNKKIDSEDYRKNSTAPLTVQVRDMSKFDKKKLSETDKKNKLEVYPSKGIQMVEIQNIVDKNSSQHWEWANEFSLIKDKALFYTYGYHAIKLPANIYDDQEYKTDIYGIAKNGTTEERMYQKGVWLCGYQLKVYLTRDNTLYRTTGMQVGWDQNTTIDKHWYTRDHFHCSLFDNGNGISIYNFNAQNSSYDDSMASGIGIFPYERAWSKNYPEKYSIPKKPSILNFQDPHAQRPYMESPTWKDGDIIVGNSWYGFAGFGLGYAYGQPQYTDFSTDVVGGANSFSDMYRYEPTNTGAGGCYGNGYCQEFDFVNSGNGLGAKSSVVGAEKFQRVEAGYGYYLFPNSMPRVISYPWYFYGMHINEVDFFINNASSKALSTQSELQSGLDNAYEHVYTHHYHSFSVQNNGKSVAMDLYKKKYNGDSIGIVNDNLNIYRIISGIDRVSHSLQQLTIPSSAILNFGYEDQCHEMTITNTGEENVKITNTFTPFCGGTITVENPTGSTVYLNGQTFTLDVGGKIIIPHYQTTVQPIEIINQVTATYEITTIVYAKDIISYSTLNLPGNAEYSEENNYYTKAKYKIHVIVQGNLAAGDDPGPWYNQDTTYEEGNQTTTQHHWIQDGGSADIYLNLDAKPIPDNWYINTDSTGTPECEELCDGKGDRFGITQWKLESPAWWRIWVNKTKACDVSSGVTPCD